MSYREKNKNFLLSSSPCREPRLARRAFGSGQRDNIGCILIFGKWRTEKICAISLSGLLFPPPLRPGPARSRRHAQRSLSMSLRSLLREAPDPARPSGVPRRRKAGARWRVASHARREIGEAAAAGDDGVELAELLVAPVIAALGDELARHVELLPRLVSEPGGRGGVGQSGRRRARRDEAVQRREGLAPREREPRAFERAIAEIRAASAPARRSPATSSRSRAAPSQSPMARRKAARASRPRGT